MRILKDEGNEATALEYVNKVRRRAYGYGFINCVFPDRHYVQPIPVSELERNPEMTQTSGYKN